MDPKLLGLGAAALFGIYADLAFNIYSATNSSPQTTELFAGDRADTLMKWVWVGGGAVLVFGVFGTILATKATGRLNLWPLFGSLSVGGVMYFMYCHALKAGNGKENDETIPLAA